MNFPKAALEACAFSAVVAFIALASEGAMPTTPPNDPPAKTEPSTSVRRSDGICPNSAGSFQMGSLQETAGDADETPRHKSPLPGRFISENASDAGAMDAAHGGNPSHFKGAKLARRHRELERLPAFFRETARETGRTFACRRKLSGIRLSGRHRHAVVGGRATGNPRRLRVVHQKLRWHDASGRGKNRTPGRA